MVERNVVTYTVVCDQCGKEFNSEAKWLDDSHDCMPDRNT